jgi:hypothetical protein
MLPGVAVPIQPLGQQGLVFRPGGTAGPGVYTTLGSLQSAAQAIRGGVNFVQVDGSAISGGAFTFPAGVYNFGPYPYFQGLPDADALSIGYPKFNFAAGVTFAGTTQALVIDTIQVTANNTAAAVITNAGHFALKVLGLGQILQGGGATKPFIENASGAVTSMLVKDFGYTAGVAAAGIIHNASASSTINLSTYDAGFCDVSSFTGTITTGPLNITPTSPANGCDGSFALTLNLFPGVGYSAAFANPNSNVSTGGNLGAFYISNATGTVWANPTGTLTGWIQIAVP